MKLTDKKAAEIPIRIGLVIVTAVLLALSLIRPPFPVEQALQHAPTVVALGLLLVAAQKNWLKTPAFCCVIAFLWLHILGARYIYSFVPYDDWLDGLFGIRLSDWFGWRRNHYDRWGHFWFGILAVVPLYEIARDRGALDRRWASGFALSSVMAISGLYEMFEWVLTLVVSPEQAEAYNGQQGDFWDAQKDMALALSGALIAVWVLLLRSKRDRVAERHFPPDG